MDFSTLDKRRRACEAEIAINRPSAPELYLGAMPVVRRDGRLHLGGAGDVVEWVVHMRRFDETQTLDRIATKDALPRPSWRSSPAWSRQPMLMPRAVRRRSIP